MKPRVYSSVPLRSVGFLEIVRFNGVFYVRGSSSSSHGIRLIRVIHGCTRIINVYPDTLVDRYIGYPLSYAGFGPSAL